MAEVQELMKSIRQWADEDPDLEPRGTKAKLAGLRYRIGDNEPADIDVSSSGGSSPKVELRASIAIDETQAISMQGNSPAERDESLRGVIRDIEVARAGPLRCTMETKGKTKRVDISYPLHPGLSRQSFMAAVAEVAKASAQVQAVLGMFGKMFAVLQDSPTDAGAPSPSVEEFLPQLGEETAKLEAGPVEATKPLAPVGGPPVRPPESSGTGWSATHVAPPEGIQAWVQPDPASQSTQLQPGTELRVVQRSGDWAQVSAVNGWTGWVDGRRLVATTPG